MNLGTLSYPRKQVSPPSFRLIRGYEDQLGSRDVTRFHAGLFNTTERSPATDRFAPADFNESASVSLSNGSLRVEVTPQSLSSKKISGIGLRVIGDFDVLLEVSGETSPAFATNGIYAEFGAWVYETGPAKCHGGAIYMGTPGSPSADKLYDSSGTYATGDLTVTSSVATAHPPLIRSTPVVIRLKRYEGIVRAYYSLNGGLSFFNVATSLRALQTSYTDDNVIVVGGYCRASSVTGVRFEVLLHGMKWLDPRTPHQD